MSLILRKTLVVLVVLQWCRGDFGDESDGWCERVCAGSRPQVPTPCPPAPACPVPICPAPLVNLSCPEPRCPAPPPPPLPPTEYPSCPACTPRAHSHPAPAPTAAPFLPFGYLSYPNVGVYKFYPIDVDWLEANATCFEDGGYLAVPKSRAELNVLVHILEINRNKKAFIGFHDFYYEGNYRTVLGQPMNSFQHTLWGSGEPDGGVKRNAVYLKSDGRIYDYYNAGTFPFICELPLHIET